MVRQTGEALFDERDMMKRGVIVRHLLLPGYMENAKKVVEYVYETYGDQVFLSLMNQYTPLPQVEEFPEINRRVTEEEYEELVDYAIEIGVENGFIQEGETAEESFIPAFDYEGRSTAKALRSCAVLSACTVKSASPEKSLQPS